MCAGVGMLSEGWQCLLGMAAGQPYSQILTVRLRFSRETSKGVVGANHVERGRTVGGVGKGSLMYIKFV